MDSAPLSEVGSTEVTDTVGPMTSEEILLVEQRDSVRILTFNRPEARNALSSAR